MAINMLRKPQFFCWLGTNQASSGKFQELPSLSSDAILEMRRFAFRHRRFDGMLVWRPEGFEGSFMGQFVKTMALQELQNMQRYMGSQYYLGLEMSCTYWGGSCAILHCFQLFALPASITSYKSNSRIVFLGAGWAKSLISVSMAPANQ